MPHRVTEGETDHPARIPRTAAEFAELNKVLPAADYERLNKPYQPLPEGCVCLPCSCVRPLTARAPVLGRRPWQRCGGAFAASATEPAWGRRYWHC